MSLCLYLRLCARAGCVSEHKNAPAKRSSINRVMLVDAGLCIGSIAALSGQSTARTGNALGLIGVGTGIAATLGSMASGESAVLGQALGEHRIASQTSLLRNSPSFVQLLAVEMLLCCNPCNAAISRCSCFASCPCRVIGGEGQGAWQGMSQRSSASAQAPCWRAARRATRWRSA